MKLIVKKESELLEYLYENLDMPKKRVKQYLTHGAIYVNNNRVKQYNYKVVPGMNIMIDTESKNKKTLPFEVLFEDEHIIVVNKPSGLLTIATAKEKERTLYHIVREYLVSKDNHAKVFIVHRLDKDTSGIVLFAKSEEIKRKFQDNWDNLVKVREYIAIVEGLPHKDKGTVRSWLKETKTLYVYSSNRMGDGKEAITHYRKVMGNKQFTMLDILIDTGRKNQIRVHMSDIGCPIIGDKKYNSKTNPIRRMGLHANKLVINHPVTGKEMVFESDLPNSFIKIVE